MNILQINKHYPPHVGGVEVVVKDVTKALSEEHDVVNLVCAEENSHKEEERDGGLIVRAAQLFKLLKMPISFDFFVSYFKRVKEADAVFLHHPFPLGFFAYALLSPRKPLYVWYHADITKQKVAATILSPLFRFVLRRADTIFVSSNNLKENSPILEDFKSSVQVVPFGIDFQYFSQPGDEGKVAEIKEQYSTPLLLGVGRLVYYKGFTYLIEAMKDLDANLIIIGSGSLKEELETQAREAGIEDKVHIISYAPDLRPYYHACDIFCFPSCAPSEAFGIVQAEAMAAGKPVVNTNLKTGVPEVSLDGRTGFTVPVGNSDALAGVLSKLIEDDRLRYDFGATARKRAKDTFSQESFAHQLNRAVKRIF